MYKRQDITKELTSDAYELKDGDAVAGIAYVIESYGLITNKTLLEKAGYTLDDIKSFDDLKKVADDIQARKDEIGVKGAFTDVYKRQGIKNTVRNAFVPLYPLVSASAIKNASTLIRILDTNANTTVSQKMCIRDSIHCPQRTGNE